MWEEARRGEITSRDKLREMRDRERRNEHKEIEVKKK